MIINLFFLDVPVLARHLSFGIFRHFRILPSTVSDLNMYPELSNEAIAEWCVSAFALSDVDVFVTDEAPYVHPVNSGRSLFISRVEILHWPLQSATQDYLDICCVGLRKLINPCWPKFSRDCSKSVQPLTSPIPFDSTYHFSEVWNVSEWRKCSEPHL